VSSLARFMKTGRSISHTTYAQMSSSPLSRLRSIPNSRARAKLKFYLCFYFRCSHVTAYELELLRFVTMAG